MSEQEYTPTMDDIKVAWMAHHIESAEDSPMPMNAWAEQFVRALTAHDREVQAQALDDFARRYSDMLDRHEDAAYLVKRATADAARIRALNKEEAS